MFGRFIVCTDLSLDAVAVVKCIGGLRVYGAQQCLLLQCLGFLDVTSAAASYSTSQIDDLRKEQKQILQQQGFRVDTRVLPGFAKKEVHRIAREEEYSLIVIGSHSHSLVVDKFFGGIAHDVIYCADKPVLVVRLQKRQREGTVCVQATRCDFSEHVLFPTDFSENADYAFTCVKELAADGAKHITLLHVQDKVRIDPYLKNRLEEFNEIDRARLEVMKEALKQKGKTDVDIELAYGAPFSEILRVTQEKKTGLVVMGNQGRGFIPEIFLGSVSHNVARYSDASVLLIPAKR